MKKIVIVVIGIILALVTVFAAPKVSHLYDAAPKAEDNEIKVNIRFDAVPFAFRYATCS